MKALGNLAALLMTALLLVPAEAHTESDTAADTEADLIQLSFWSSPIPAPDGDADPECPEPQYQRLSDIVSSFE